MSGVCNDCGNHPCACDAIDYSPCTGKKVNKYVEVSVVIEDLKILADETCSAGEETVLLHAADILTREHAWRVELEAIVERLPRTKDGVRVCPGDSDLWGFDMDGNVVEHCTAPHYFMTEGGEYESWHFEEQGGEIVDRLIPAHDIFTDEVWYGNVSALYSTKQAALDARKGGSDEP